MSKSSEKAYRLIRSGILSGHFPPGGFVTEEEFAQHCDMSRTPVREAIAELVSEMLLQRTDTNRVFVPAWSDDEIEELFTLRFLLERHAAKRASQFITADEIAQLKEHCEFIERAIERSPMPDVSGFVEGNRRFHALIIKAAQSDMLSQLMRVVISQVVIHRTAEGYTMADMVRSQNDHRDLIAAFEQRDSQWAATISSNHILRAAHTYRRRALSGETRNSNSFSADAPEVPVDEEGFVESRNMRIRVK